MVSERSVVILIGFGIFFVNPHFEDPPSPRFPGFPLRYNKRRGMFCLAAVLRSPVRNSTHLDALADADSMRETAAGDLDSTGDP